VQGRLLDRNLSCTVETVCGVSRRPIVFDIDSELGCHVRPPAEQPVFFVPMINLAELDAPCIVDDF
jgi:hypothetical protein